jgi:MinD-like ATPase involved in chromosome partitioning or flagellar assembly
MWRDFVSEADGTVKVDGVQLVAAAGSSAYAAAIEQFTTEAREAGTPVLVRSTGASGQTWFTVAPDGAVAVAEAPADASTPGPVLPATSAGAGPSTSAGAAGASTSGAVGPGAVPAAAAPTARMPSRVATPAAPAEGGGEALPTRRKPSAADFGANVSEPTPHPAQVGWRGVLNSMGMRLAPGPAELEERKWRATAQRGLAGHKTVVFVNLKGGATKTTATFMVGATLGRVRGGNLLDWDNNENQGTLGDLALPASHDLTARDLLDNIERFEVPSNSPELMNYMRPQGENRFHVLSSQNKASNTEVIDGAAFVQLHGMLRQFYHLILVDTGNAATASTWQAAVEIADEIVLVALNKADSTKKLAATVDTLVAQGLESKLAHGVLLLTEPTAPPKRGSDREKESTVNRNQAVEHFGHYVREIVHIPYDEALADGKQIVYENLQPAAQRAYLAATAAIVAGL